MVKVYQKTWLLSFFQEKNQVGIKNLKKNICFRIIESHHNQQLHVQS